LPGEICRGCVALHNTSRPKPEATRESTSKWIQPCQDWKLTRGIFIFIYSKNRFVSHLFDTIEKLRQKWLSGDLIQSYNRENDSIGWTISGKFTRKLQWNGIRFLWSTALNYPIRM
jgi:hypothetical protein